MTVLELERFKKIKARIKKYNTEIDIIQKYLDVNKDTENQTQIKKLKKLKIEINKQQKQLIDELANLVDFIETIEEPEIQTICVAKFIEGKTYNEIGDELFMHYTTVIYKLKKYLKENS